MRFRDTLEDLGGGLGVTDPVSGPGRPGAEIANRNGANGQFDLLMEAWGSRAVFERGSSRRGLLLRIVLLGASMQKKFSRLSFDRVA